MSDVEVTRSGDVITLTLNRPAKRNAITSAMYRQLAAELDAADGAGAAAVVLTGAGGASCAGMDLQAGLGAVLVAAVDGPAVGVGCTMLLHCDLVYATAGIVNRVVSDQDAVFRDLLRSR